MDSRIALQTRLDDIMNDLEGMGATKEYRLKYFSSIGGYCYKTQEVGCQSHVPGELKLPKDYMDHMDFKLMLTELDDKIMHHEQRLNYLTQSKQETKELDMIDQLMKKTQLEDKSLRQRELIVKKRKLNNAILHVFGQLQLLLGERYWLLTEVKLVDSIQFHTKCQDLMTEQMNIMRKLKTTRENM